MDIILLRHGKSVANERGLLISNEYDDLTDIGTQQSSSLAKLLEKEFLVPDTVYCSPWCRASSTAKIVFPDDVFEITYDHRLAETDPGSFGNWYEADFNRAFPDFYSDIENSYTGGESHAGMARRVCSWVEEVILPQQSSRRVVSVVSHGGPISVMLQFLLGMDIYSSYPSFTVPNASASLLRWRADLGRFVIIFVGRT